MNRRKTGYAAEIARLRAGKKKRALHLAHVGTSIVKCPKVSEEIKQKCKKNLDETAKKKKDKQQHDATKKKNLDEAAKKTKKGKDATATVLNIRFWKDVSLCLKVFEPLVKVLRLVDGDVKPSMGYVYGELLKAKREIKEAFGNVEKNYREVMAIVDKKMKDRLDSPLHVAAYMLNPYYSYSNLAIFSDSIVGEKFMLCVETFYHGEDDKEYRAVNEDLEKFQKRHGSFSKKMARSCERFEFNPASWWRLYGGGAPDLQRMAIRILSLTSSSSGCERNWSTFEQHHTKRRNRLTTERLNSLVFIQFNNKLMSKKEKITRKSNYEVLLSSDASEAQGFFFEGGDDHALVVFRDEEDEGEMPGTGIPWSVLGEAMGTNEQLQPRRSARVAREVHEEEWESEFEDPDYQDCDIAFDDDEDEEAILNSFTLAE
ncbi:unnamed protein product [Miscanthus lutarioriparius]|uniref:HAT C-terminal dimerisation domain-containing protein n=1 Tax=Miscanthus lutarioriparius TaxID=422564 RepID=A0A811QKX6_9POAL|nr:unnamed protein product [Miscanthus lutarioriparius]